MTVSNALSAFRKRPDTFEAAAREVLTYIQKTGAEIAFCLSTGTYGLTITPATASANNTLSAEALNKVRDVPGGHDVKSGIALINMAIASNEHDVFIRKAHDKQDSCKLASIQNSYNSDVAEFALKNPRDKFKVIITSKSGAPTPQVA